MKGPEGVAAAIVTVALGLLAWFASSADRVEAWYVQGLGAWLQSAPNSVTRLVGFSVTEPLVVGAALVAIGWILWTVRALWSAERPRRVLAIRAGATVYCAVGAILMLFYSLWGLSYARPPLEVRAGWAAEPPTEPLEIDPRELEALAAALVDQVNDLYLELHRTPDGFVPTLAPEGLAAADAAIDFGYARIPVGPGWPADLQRSRGPTKGLLSSRLYSWLGIGGFYFPFTAEANINLLAPEWQQPHTMAHEKAHQRFVASENEANFVGFLACVHSDDPFVRYSGWLFAQRQTLFALASADWWAFLRQVERRHPGVQRDVDHARAFWTGYDGPVAQISSAVNDAYLRANAVQGGVGSYGRSLELLVRWARARGGVMDPG